MWSRNYPIVLIIVLALSLECLAQSGDKSNASADRPNIVLISIDSLRADHLGCYGYEAPASPFIDKLAAEGARFDNAVSTTSWTLPAHAALFTGLYNSAHGLVDNQMKLSENHLTLAERLAAVGYRTAGFYGGPHLHPIFGLAQGFQTYENCMMMMLKNVESTELTDGQHHLSHVDITGPRTVRKLAQWLEETPADKPLFLFLHFWDVHYDYIPPRRFLDLFDPDYEGDLKTNNFMRNNDVNPEMSARDLQHLVALYDAEIRFTDDSIKQAFELLEQHGRMKNTLTIILSDHGDEFFEHGWKGHQRTLFEEMVRVPLIVHWPGHINSKQVVPDQVRIIDIAPALTTLVDADSSNMQGRDIAPLWRGDKLPPAPALCELLVENRNLRALRTNEWKIILDGKRNQAFFFKYPSDLAERKPAVQKTEAFIAAVEMLKRERDLSIAFGLNLDSAPGDVKLNEKIRERLEALGYLDADDEP